MPHYLIGEKKLASKHIMVAYTESSRIERRLSTTQQFSIDDVIYYNYKVNGDPSVLNCPQTDTEDDHPILRKEVEAAVQFLEKGKWVGVDNIRAELVQAGGEDVSTAFMTICNKIWKTVDPVLSHHTSQERQPAAVPELPNSQPHQSPKQS